jgi:hypothetical protein
MNADQKLQLNQMITANNVEDNTDLIRELKHSKKFTSEIEKMQAIKKKFKTPLSKIKVGEPIYTECATQCPFMYEYYTDLFNKILKDEVDMSLLQNGINVLREIEIGKTDMHEASFKFGTILKKIYVDAAINKADAINAANDVASTQPVQARNISWNKYKAYKCHISSNLSKQNKS